MTQLFLVVAELTTILGRLRAWAQQTGKPRAAPTHLGLLMCPSAFELHGSLRGATSSECVPVRRSETPAASRVHCRSEGSGR